MELVNINTLFGSIWSKAFPKKESLKLTAQVNPGTANLDFTYHLLTLKFHFLSFKSIFVQAKMALFS